MSSPANSIILEHEGELIQDVDMEDNDGDQAEEDNDDNKENEEEKKVVVKPKRVVRNPRPKLDVQLLRGPKGLCAIEKYFKNNKYNGPGYEASDLRTIMKTYEYWCHRLFPKYSFDDCIDKIEKLGNKKNMQTYIKRIRLGMDDFVDTVDKPIVSDDEMEQPVQEEDVPSTRNDLFDSLVPQPVQRIEQPVQLTEEQLERIRINKENANKIRMEKLKKMQEKASALIGEASNLPSTSSDGQSQHSNQGECSSISSTEREQERHNEDPDPVENN